MGAFPPFENIVETCTVTDTFCTDIIKVERLGPCARITFAVRQVSEDGRGGKQLDYLVVNRLIVPCDMLVTMGVTLVQRPDLKLIAQTATSNRELH